MCKWWQLSNPIGLKGGSSGGHGLGGKLISKVVQIWGEVVDGVAAKHDDERRSLGGLGQGRGCGPALGIGHKAGGGVIGPSAGGSGGVGTKGGVYLLEAEVDRA